MFGILALAISLPTVGYPFGRDQGLYFYVAREWVQHGAIPYRDVLDHKTPGIYLLYGLAVRLFGANMWGIRVLDIVGVVITGLVAASLSVSRGEPIRPGTRGAAIFGTALIYFGYLDFWNTAQSELWYAMLSALAVACALRNERLVRGAVYGGLAAGAAMLMKPPAIFGVFVAMVVLGVRARREKNVMRALAGFAAGGAALPALVLGYFGIRHALPAMVDIVVGANGYYVRHEGAYGDPLANVGVYIWSYTLLYPLVFVYLAITILRRRARDRHWISIALLLAGFAATVMQGKYYLLHFSSLITPVAVVLANLYRDLSDRLDSRRALTPPVFAVPLLLAWLFAPFGWFGFERWRSAAEHLYRYERGRETPEAFAANFDMNPLGFNFERSLRIGDWLREHTTPNDLVAVRSFQPEIYAVADRHFGGRFFWTTFITSPVRAYRREEWLKEDRDSLIAHPPKYAVVLSDQIDGPDSIPFFRSLGYEPVQPMFDFTIMEKR